MASNLIRYSLIPLAAVALTLSEADAQAPGTSYTIPAGYVQVTVLGNSLGVISATLTNRSEFTGALTINSDFAAGSQTINVSNVAWSAGDWTGAAHLLYIADGSGAEEAFLITSNGASTLTIATDYDLLGRIPASTTGTIRLAQTLAGIMGTPANTQVDQTDNVYLWGGSSWTRYFHNGSIWRSTGFGDKSDTVIYPDEGMFVQRNVGTDLTLTLFGDVPASNQISTIPGAGLYFMSSRFPVDTTIGTLGLQNLPNWVNGNASSGDAVYLWSSGSWTRYYYNGSQWRSTGFGDKTNDPVPADSAVFVQRQNANPANQSGNIHVLPYTP